MVKSILNFVSMYDFLPPPMNSLDNSCQTPRSKTPVHLATFPDTDCLTPSNKHRTISTDLNPFELRSESEDQEQIQNTSNIRFSISNKLFKEPKTIPEPKINNSNRGFHPPELLARSPKSNNINEPEDEEIYMTESLIAQYANDDSKNYFKCFIDDDYYQPNTSLSKPKNEFTESISSKQTPQKPQITCFQDFKNKIQNNSKSEFTHKDDFQEFDAKMNNSLANQKLNNVAFDEVIHTNDYDELPSIGLSTKFGQARLLNFDENGFLPISTEDTVSPRPFHNSPPPLIPEVVTPYNYQLEFLKNEAEENLKRAKIEWETKISQQKQLSQQRFSELIEKQRLELLPYEQYRTSPQRLELINRKDEREREIPIIRVRTVPSDSITKAIKDYESMNHDVKTKKTFFKATPDSQSRYKRGPLLTSVQSNKIFMGDNSENKQKIRTLKEKHKQEIITLDQECLATLKALEDKRNADIHMKETHLQNILTEIENQNETKSNLNQFDFNKRTLLNHRRQDNQDFNNNPLT